MRLAEPPASLRSEGRHCLWGMGRAEADRMVATSNDPNRRSSIMSHPPTTASAGASPYLALLGRLLLAVIFLLSGYGKLTAASGTIAYIQSAGLSGLDLAPG